MSDKQEILKELLNKDEIKTNLRHKKSRFQYESIKKNEIEEYLNDDWEIQKENKNTFRIKKEKPLDIWFEDRVWTLFAKMGFQYMNADRLFTFKYAKDPSVPGKQIDVFAVDDETIFLIECKTSKERKQRYFQKEINEINGIRSKIVPKLKKSFSGKKKIKWVFCTENIVLSNNDKARLEDHNIFHLNQDDINYYEQLINQLGISAKYQLFARIFANQEIPEIKNKVPAIKGKMGGYIYYSFSIEPDTLLKISYILHRINTSNDTLNTYQRMVKKNRINQIDKFLDGENNFFPNAIIINIDTRKGKPLEFDVASASEHNSNSKLGVLHLPKRYKSAFVIDGQHRLYGYGKNQYRFTHTIPVIAFENLPSDKQANLFVEINHKQKSVPSNLLKSLDAELKWNSPIADDAINALKSKLAQILNEREESPLYNRIIMGEDRGTQTKCITLTYIFDYALNKTNYFGEISKRDLIRTGPLYAGDLAEKTLNKAYKFFHLLFSLFEEKLPEQWRLGSGNGGFVARNIGISSIIVITWDILQFQSHNNNIAFEKISSEDIFDEIKPFIMVIIKYLDTLSPDDLYNMSRQWGSTGVTKVRREFQRQIYQQNNDFTPEGLLQFIKESSGIYNDETRTNIFKIQNSIKNHIFDMLKKEFGTNSDNWWRLGVPKPIQKECAVKAVESDPPEPPENFVLVLNYQSIIKTNWKLLGDYYTPPDNQKGNKESKLSWFVRFNTIRNRVTHPERKDVTEDEYYFIRSIKSWLLPKIGELDSE